MVAMVHLAIVPGGGSASHSGRGGAGGEGHQDADGGSGGASTTYKEITDCCWFCTGGGSCWCYWT